MSCEYQGDTKNDNAFILYHVWLPVLTTFIFSHSQMTIDFWAYGEAGVSEVSWGVLKEREKNLCSPAWFNKVDMNTNIH